jgi:plastocyanin
MRKLFIIGLLAALLGTLLAAAPALSKRKTVEVDDNYFAAEGKPRTVTVKLNDTVVWEFEGRFPHNVTVTKGPVKFKSKNKSSGTYAKKLKTAGTYKIVCTLHPPDMKMTLKVQR